MGVLTSNTGRFIKDGYVKNPGKTWKNPKTWTTHKPKFYTILGFQGIKKVGWKFLIRRLAGTWGFKFPKASFKFVIRNQRITIGRRTIKLRPSKNKRYPGWQTFRYKNVIYYIRFTTK